MLLRFALYQPSLFWDQALGLERRRFHRAALRPADSLALRILPALKIAAHRLQWHTEMALLMAATFSCAVLSGTPGMDICPGKRRVLQVANLRYVSTRRDRGAARGMGSCLESETVPIRYHAT